MKSIFNFFRAKTRHECLKVNKIVYESGMYFEIIDNEWFPIEETDKLSKVFNKDIYNSYLGIDRLIMVQDLFHNDLEQRRFHN